MSNNNEILQQLSKHLFWDVDISEVDVEKHVRFIVERVVTRGNLNDFKLLLKTYTKKMIAQNVVKIRSLDKKTINFLSIYFDIDKKDFRCYS
ncbi:MAG: hypothetical protein DRP35_11170 [Candidatus Zixiibacteriota bacterium]|nr:MAG: hypothetical protein DRP35_11170 [candidate division Zixibacteria bacterium]